MTEAKYDKINNKENGWRLILLHAKIIKKFAIISSKFWWVNLWRECLKKKYNH